MAANSVPRNGFDAPVAEQTPPPVLTTSGELVRQHGPSLLGRAAEQAERILRRYAYPDLLYVLKLRGSFPLRLLASPADPWPGDAARGEALADGEWRWGGYAISSGGPPFDDPNQPPGFADWLQSFAWLRDLAALNDQAAAVGIAEPALKQWLELYGKYDEAVWRPDISGRRIIFWTSYAPIILSSKDLVHRSKVLTSLARQSRHLARTAGHARDGLPRLAAITGLIYSGLLLAGGDGRVSSGLSQLDRALDRLVLADGGFLSRNPADLLAALRLMISLRDVFRQRQVEPSAGLQRAIDRMVPMLKGLTHPDGTLASFNGARPLAARDLALTFDLADASGRAIEKAPMTGYQRIAAGSATLIVDAGPPPPSGLGTGAHAAPLALELSIGEQRVFVNCGGTLAADPVAREVAWMVRTTAAHSTLVVNDTNAAQIRSDGEIGYGPTKVEWVRREGEAGTWLDLLHDGCVRRFGFLHQRRLFIDASGRDIRGEDSILQAPSGFGAALTRRRAERFDLRFHLHPHVEATATRDGRSAILRLADRTGWMLRAQGAALAIEESLYIDAGCERRRNQQIVLSGKIESLPVEINWTLKSFDG